jgi:indolepyruvate ferredoxin oxidoreductase
MSPPILEKPDPATGEAKKRAFGPWMLKAMRVLAKMKFLRGTVFDVFGHTAERKEERALIGEYEETITELLQTLDPARIELAAEIASIPEFIRGYGHVKQRHLKDAKAREADLLAQWRDPSGKKAEKRIPIRAAA